MKKIITAITCLSALSGFVSAQNPVLVKDIDTARDESSAPKELTSFNNKLYFTADAKRWNGFGMVSNRELWMSNGSGSGTQMVIDLNNQGGNNNSSSAPVGLKVWKNKLYFFAVGSDGKQNLFETDGTAANTKQITTVGFIVTIPYGLRTQAFTEFNNALYFVASDWSDAGYELWKTDGTAAGTVMVKDLNPSKGMLDSKSDIHQLTVMGDRLYFFGNDQATDDSLQLWKTDGTAAATEKIATYRVGNSLALYSLTATNTHLYFTHNRDIYKSDGTTAGTTLFMPNCDPYHFTAYKGEMLFVYYTNNPYTAHLAITSSEASGYTAIKDGVTNLSATSGTYYMPLVIADNKLFYHEGVSGGTELWQSDGTAAGTKLVKTIPAAEGYIVESDFFKHKNDVYFTTRLNNSEYLYKTDGTAAGTVQVSAVTVPDIDRITSVENVLFFTSDAEVNGRIGEELWKIGTDTTSGGGGSTGVRVISGSESKLAIYPNPASDVLNIRMQDAADKISAAALYDITGKLVAQLEANDQTGFTCNVSRLENGPYFLQVTTTSGVAVKRIVIAK